MAAPEKNRYAERDIALDIENSIVENKLAVGSRLDTTAQLARRYLVSEKTVHRAISRLVERKLLYRVRGSGTYVRNNISFSDRLNVAVFVCRPFGDMLADFFSTAFEAEDILIEGLKAQGHRAQLVMTNDIDYEMRRLELERYDVIVASAGFAQTSGRLLRSINSKVILIRDDVVTPGPWHQLVYDYTPGFRKALEYLKQQNCRDVFVAGVWGRLVSERRRDAVYSAAEQCGFPAERLHYYAGDPGAMNIYALAGQDCAKHYLNCHSRNTGILSLSDFITVGMHDEFSRNNIDMRELKLISYDKLQRFFPENPLLNQWSSIVHPARIMGEQTLRMIEEICRRDEPIYRVFIVPATELELDG